MFLVVLSGAGLALALVAQARGFDEGLTTFALLILPVVLFVGIATFMRLVAINHEDVAGVIGMNLLRHAYLAAAPELRRHIVAGSSDDEAGIMATIGARPGRGSFIHELATTPGVARLWTGLLGILTMRARLDDVIRIGIAGAGALATVALQLLYSVPRCGEAWRRGP